MSKNVRHDSLGSFRRFRLKLISPSIQVDRILCKVGYLLFKLGGEPRDGNSANINGV